MSSRVPDWPSAWVVSWTHNGRRQTVTTGAEARARGLALTLTDMGGQDVTVEEYPSEAAVERAMERVFERLRAACE